MSISATTRSLQFDMTDEEIAALPLFGTDDDYGIVTESFDPEEHLMIPAWVLMGGAMVGALVIAAVIFYISYRQEWCCGVHAPEEEEDHVDLEKGKKLKTKTFKDSTQFERLSPSAMKRLPEDMDESGKTANSNESSCSGCSSGAKTFEQMASTPRCVLCSKNFTIGENVTHSPGCHHEFHENCLMKYWTQQKKSKKPSDRCPICKVTYVVAEVSPSQHFSLHLPAGDNTAKTKEEEVQPFSVTV